MSKETQVKGNHALQSDLIEMYLAFLHHDHDTTNMDEVEIDKLYDTLENFEKYVDTLLRDYITFSIKHRGQSLSELLQDLKKEIDRICECD